MSYCRFSSDDFGCDVYVYEDVSGGWTIHLATKKVVGEVPKVPSFDDPDFFRMHKKQMKFLKKAKRVYIGLPLDGTTFREETPNECAERLIEIREMGYRVPQNAIDSLLEEAAE